MPEPEKQLNRYQAILKKIFFDHFKDGSTELAWSRSELITAAANLDIELPKNLGDVVYSVRFRTPMPQSILDTQPVEKEWIIEGAGRSRYMFKLVPISRIVPNSSLVTVKIPDATPEIIATHALTDEQALLAKVRYNRLLDIFLGMATFSLQSHLRTTVKGIGQIEIDEIYVGVDRRGVQYVVPVQAKGGSDQLSVVQSRQDIACCNERFPTLICRSVSTQFMENDLIALFELTVEDGQVKVVDERHYRLVSADQISDDELRSYSARS
jgi:hypothetical protein